MIEIYIIGGFLFLLLASLSFFSLMAIIESVEDEETKYLKRRAKERKKRLDKVRNNYD